MAQAPSRTKVGTMTCDISAGIGLHRHIEERCRLHFHAIAAGFALRRTPARSQEVRPRPRRHRRGENDLGRSLRRRPNGFGALAGNYGGASAEATVGAGVGANVLVGGSNRTVTLQPVSVQGQAGLNLAVGGPG